MRNVNELVNKILDTRKKTEPHRFKTLNQDVEKVSDVLNDLMLKLSEHFASYNFKYSKSKKQIHKTTNGFRHEITCESDSNNLSGVQIGIGFQISVKNNKFKAWESEVFPYDGSENLVVSSIGDLVAKDRYFKWDLVDPSSRSDKIDEIINLVEKYVLPFFENFNSRDKYAEFLKQSDFRVVFKHYAVEHAVWLGEISLAHKLIEEILDDKELSSCALKQKILYFLKHGYPDIIDVSDEISYWARASIQMGLFE